MLRNSDPSPGKSKNIELLTDFFSPANRPNIETLICGSSLYKWAESTIWPDQEPACSLSHAHADTPEPPESATVEPTKVPHTSSRSSSPRTEEQEPNQQKLSAKLHALYGVPVQHLKRGSRGSTTTRYALRGNTEAMVKYVRSKVYDLRQHTDHTFWGPFLDDGSQDVDWEKIEAIMLILDYNLKTYARAFEVPNDSAIPDWTKPFNGTNPYSYASKKSSIPMQPTTPLEAQDPYNITGTWIRIVCFVDYNELYSFNFREGSPKTGRPRPPFGADEAIRLITKRIRVTKIESPGEDDGQALPKVHFRGISSSVRPTWDPNANSLIRGVQNLCILSQDS